MFVLGVLAYRRGWFAKLPVKAGWIGLATAIVGLVILVPAFGLGRATEGGLTWQSAYMSAGQAIFCVGVVLALLILFRQRFNSQRRLGAFLAPQAYAVYVIHATILVAIGYALSGLSLPPLAKFGVAAVLALPICWSLAWLIRRIPGIQRVL
jgi:glucan biosynthesis protein C